MPMCTKSTSADRALGCSTDFGPFAILGAGGAGESVDRQSRCNLWRRMGTGVVINFVSCGRPWRSHSTATSWRLSVRRHKLCSSSRPTAVRTWVCLQVSRCCCRLPALCCIGQSRWPAAAVRQARRARLRAVVRSGIRVVPEAACSALGGRTQTGKSPQTCGPKARACVCRSASPAPTRAKQAQ